MDIPRRAILSLYTPAEKAIYDAMQEVEKVGAAIDLTEAITLLEQAQNKVADFIDAAIEDSDITKKGG